MNASHRYRVVRTLTVACLALAVAACTATSGTVKRTPARVDIEEAVGFTITEQARIPGGVRDDYDRALALLSQGNTRDGITLLEAIVEKAPGLSAPRIDLGIAHHRSGDLDAAEKHLVQALELNARHPNALNELGIIYRKTARFAEARRSYEAALDVYPGYHFARRNLAILCDLYLSDLECARTNYEAYMATVISDDEVSMWLKDVNYRSGLEE